MNIPPFPAQDLAKLVLGYLAEEQLMTAYDEFLSASPYLDAMRNEYDRIFMTSLKNILAEYRAVKIYVETCKPLALRRRLYGCTNLLEIVKFLVQNIDVNKIQCTDRNQGSISNQSIEKSDPCAVCTSLRLANCVCKSRQGTLISSNVESLQETSVETTSLEDLPGNNAVRKKHVRTLPKDSKRPPSVNSDRMDTIDTSNVQNAGHTLVALGQAENVNFAKITKMQLNTVQVNQRVDQLSSFTSSCSNSSLHHSTESASMSSAKSNTTLTAGTFVDFTKGVRGKENARSIVPDSSTSENISVQIKPKESSNTSGITDNQDGPRKTTCTAQILLQHQTNTKSPSDALQGKDQMVNIPDSIKHRSTEQKVTILSDIKVDKAYSHDSNNMPAILKNATSTPLMHMQTILINGTPVFRASPPVLGANRNFTKDEIMAMPTIIVVPTSGTPQIPTCVKPSFVQADTKQTTTTVSSSALLEPMIIDIPSNSPDTGLPILDSHTQKKGNESSFLVKTVSVPKDSEASHKNTPQGPPPLRKSSSTPRRNTHIRVLDFTTPRRIFEEPITEKTTEGEGTSVEVVVTKSPSLHTLADPSCVQDVTNSDSIKTNKTESSDVCPKTGKRNWDTELRALAVTNSKEALSQVPESRITSGCRRTPKPADKKKKLSLDKKHSAYNTLDKNKSNSNNDKSKTPKTKISKSRRQFDTTNEDSIIVVDDNVGVPVKPTINIITGPDWNVPQEFEKEKNVSNQSNNAEERDTPEMERFLLQNAIGSKLNISDLLETPYKQALYEIQMDTPRFLGPDLPDAPMSEVKIMNIPTPRFLNTPKPPGTPYMTRPTDYSSGSSYYKPDDQDYVPVDLGYPESCTNNKEPTREVKVSLEKLKDKKTKANSSKSSRPVRKCRKNVSYVNNSVVITAQETGDKLDETMTCSDIDSCVAVNEHENAKKSVKEIKSKTKNRSTSRKTKTPTKKDTPKSFMKIKPRRPTPTKVKGRGRPRMAESRSRKVSINKETSEEVTHAVVSLPSKSRRKSSTPRKLHCPKTFNSESSESSEISPKSNVVETKEVHTSCPPDSDSEQISLRWVDECSQDSKPKEQTSTTSAQETDDISQIKEYIASGQQQTTSNTKPTEIGSNVHVDLVKRGFDLETAKIIERDLLDIPPEKNTTDETKRKNDEAVLDKTLESDASTSLKIVQDEVEDDEEIELSVSQCDHESVNYIAYEYDGSEENQNKNPPEKLKDKFSMEVCIDDGVVVRLRATPFTVMLELDPKDENNYRELAESVEYNPRDVDRHEYNPKETEIAVRSISNIEKLYTPMKDTIRAQVYDIFDSTLTSLDTPVKINSPDRKECDTTVTETVLEVEKVKEIEKSEQSKRKRDHSEDSNDSPRSSKKSKPDAQSLLNSASNFNFDIESVLYKLHGS